MVEIHDKPQIIVDFFFKPQEPLAILKTLKNPGNPYEPQGNIRNRNLLLLP